MNKTININLAGTFFHIDEDAYAKLQRYIEAIKRSFSTTQGRDEIISDIEARISELFSEKMQHDRQVISIKEVEEVITIMGQPEDYLVDEDIFEDAPPRAHRQKTATKQFYRDIDDKFIGGVCSGLGHYLSIDPVWIRLAFILFAVLTGFGFIAYILFWILVPEANTTARKLAMKGEPVNISNIEKKIKESFDDVSEKVKNVDYEKMGKKVKSSSRTFFDTIGNIIMFFFKVIGKFIGVILLITGAATLIGLFIGMFTVGFADIIHIPGVDFVDVFNTSGMPIWLISLLVFFAIGIPFFFLFYLGLKILVTNLKSIGNIAKFSLLGLWIISIIVILMAGVRQASEYAFEETVTSEEELVWSLNDTIIIKMNEENTYEDRYYRNSDFDMIRDENGNEKIWSKDVDLNIRHAADTDFVIKVRKEAHGSSYDIAKKRASGIEYEYATRDNTILLNTYLTTPVKNKFRDQEVDTDIYVPTGAIVKLDTSVSSHIGRGTKNDQNYYRSGVAGHIWKMGEDGELKCLDCPSKHKENTQDQENQTIKNDTLPNKDQETVRI